MLTSLSESWGFLLFRAVLSILFGLTALLLPGITLTGLIFYFGAYAALSGALTIVIAIGVKGRPGFGTVLFEGLLGIAAGVLTFIYPGITALALLAVIAAWAVLSGGMAIATAIVLRRELTGEWILVTTGGLSILFGVLLLMNAAAGLLSLVWLIGAYAMASGIVMIPLALRLRQLAQELSHARA
jgi:uncharacterized membrane protein HdeD (DUF308 family)